MYKFNIQVAEKTLNLLKKKPWDKIRLKEIIIENKNKNISINSKMDLLVNINRYVDYLLKKKKSSIERSNKKDMLFEAMMLRFEILQKYRKSFYTLFVFFKSRPEKSLILIPSFLESMSLLAAFASIETKGIKGSLTIKGIFVVYVVTYFQWLSDSSKSLEKTMTALDQNLDKASSILNYI